MMLVWSHDSRVIATGDWQTMFMKNLKFYPELSLTPVLAHLLTLSKLLAITMLDYNYASDGYHKKTHPITIYYYPSAPPCVMKSEVDVNARSKVGRTPLHDAVTIGHIDVVEILLENQANPNCTARTDELASFEDISDSMADMVDTINSTVTPLQLACYQKKIDMMKV